MKLKIENLSFSYPTQDVFKELSLDLNFQNLLLMGPSGGGKSTFMRLLCGLEVPQSGKIFWDSEELPRSEAELRSFRKKIGVVFQSFNLFPHLSALENISLPLVKVHGVSKDEAKERSLSALKSFSLLEHADKMPAKLSGGQKQRVAILRAMITKPKFLFLDEPTSALDPYMTLEVLKMISDVGKEHVCPVILVTHHIAFAKKMSANCLVISNGKIKFSMDTSDLINVSEDDFLSKYL